MKHMMHGRLRQMDQACLEFRLIGFLALDFDRHVVVLVLLRTSRYGGEVAAPVARRILQAIR